MAAPNPSGEAAGAAGLGAGGRGERRGRAGTAGAQPRSIPPSSALPATLCLPMAYYLPRNGEIWGNSGFGTSHPLFFIFIFFLNEG